MKEVKLIKFDTENIVVDDIRNCVEMYRHDNPINKIVSSHEYIPQFVDVENMRIELIVDQGVEHYIAVSEKVWEYLYLIENPVTAETQQRKIDDLRDYQAKAMVTIELQHIKYKRIVESSLLTRIKWLFTGAS